MGFIGNLPGFPAVKEFGKSIKRIYKVIAMSLVYYFFETNSNTPCSNLASRQI